MCFSLGCFSLNSDNQYSNNSNTINSDINNSDTDSSIILRGHGQTKRYKTNVDTMWKDVRIIYNPQLRRIDGIGISVFNGREYMFLLFGNVEQTINNQKIIKIKKIHPSIDGLNGNCIEYTGIYSNSNILGENDIIYLISQQSSGYLKLKMI